MFCGVARSRELTQLRLFGVEGEREIPLLRDAWIEPFHQCRIDSALQGMERRQDGRARLQAAVRDALSRYDSRRRSGRHNGPRLQGIRLYRLHWTLDPWARNADRPDQKDLILEVMSAPDGSTHDA
jgi:hypothetical protein